LQIQRALNRGRTGARGGAQLLKYF